MHRLFVGLELPDEVKARLGLIMGGLDGVRWQSDQQLHLTLRFIGEVDRATAEDISLALGVLCGEPFDVALSGLGTFGRAGNPRVLWAGIAEPGPVKHLHEKIDQALVRIGVAPEQRKFKPHVTLARFRRGAPPRLGDYVAQHTDFTAPVFRARRFTLFESHLCADGAFYEPIQTYALDPLEAEFEEGLFDFAEIGGTEGLHMEEHRIEIV